MSTAATGRPTERIPVVPQLLVVTLAGVAVFELASRTKAFELLNAVPFGPEVLAAAHGMLAEYVRARAWVLAHPVQATLWAGAGLSLVLIATRYWLLLWHNQIVARLSGTYFGSEADGFPHRKFDLLREIARRPRGSIFVCRRHGRSGEI